MNLNYDFRVFIVGAGFVLLAGVLAFASDTDTRIEAAIKDSYVFKTYLKNDNIQVQSQDGVVSLSGIIVDENHAALAEETASHMPGVQKVENKLLIQPDNTANQNDTWLSMKIKMTLLFHRNVSATQTDVSVKEGVVTLKGEAANVAQKELTEEYVKDVEGVKAVKNEMTIATNSRDLADHISQKIDDASITAQVKMALFLHHSTSALKTGVETQEGVVTLTGKANNEAEKDLVTKLVSDVNGVDKVVNNMAIDVVY